MSTLTTPVDAAGGLSPLWIGGLGLLVLALLVNVGSKQVRRVKRSLGKRSRRRARIAALKAEIKQLKA